MNEAAVRDRSGWTLGWIGVGVLAGLAFVLTLIATRHGPGVSPDSVSYVAAARSIAHGGAIVDFDGSALTYWPPGFPALLAVAEVVGVGLTTGARLINGAMLAGTVVLSYVLLRRHLRSPWTILVGVAAVALSPALLRTADMVWSEPTFTVLALATVVLLEAACRSGRLGIVALAGVAASAASLVRYLGFALIVAGFVAIVLTYANVGSDTARTVRVRVVAALWFTFWAVVGPLTWGLSNALQGEPPFGPRTSGPTSLASIAGDELIGIGGLVVPEGAPDLLAGLVGFAVVALVVGAVVVVVRDVREQAMTPLLATLVALMAVTLASRITAGTSINPRILSPIYPLLVVVALWWFEYARRSLPSEPLRGVVTIVAAMGVAGLVALAMWTMALAWSHGRAGRGYAAPSTRGSELIAAARELPSGALLYSDDPLSMAYVAERPTGVLLAAGAPNDLGRERVTAADVEDAACARAVYVAWFGPKDTVPVDLTDQHAYRDGTLGRVAATCE